jgi:hypothetical protein
MRPRRSAGTFNKRDEASCPRRAKRAALRANGATRISMTTIDLRDKC